MERKKRQQQYSLCSFASSPRARGVPVLLDAMRLLQEQIPSIQLTLVMPERFHEEYQEKVPECVSLLPYTLSRSELYDLLQRHDVLLHPTLQDSFGMVVLEALSCGLPIVATDVYALRELVLDGETGYLFPPSVEYYTATGVANAPLWNTAFESVAPRKADPESVSCMVDAVVRLHEHERWERMSAAAQAHFDQTFSPHAWHCQVDSILRGMDR